MVEREAVKPASSLGSMNAGAAAKRLLAASRPRGRAEAAIAERERRVQAHT